MANYYDIATDNGQNLNSFSQAIYYVSEPRTIKNTFTLNMAYEAKEKYAAIGTKINKEITKYKDDKQKCNQLLTYLEQISKKGETIAENLLNAQTSIKQNLYLSDGTSPGLTYSQEAAKQLNDFIDIRINLKEEINNKIKEIETSISVLEDDYYPQIIEKVRNLNYKIKQYLERDR